jgi:hypothetical protein
MRAVAKLDTVTCSSATGGVAAEPAFGITWG